MPSPQEDKKFYIRVPSLDFPKGGPIKIGNIITDIFSPHDAISELQSPLNIVNGSSYGEGNKERELRTSAGLDITSTIYGIFGARAHTKQNNNMKHTYEFQGLEVMMLEKNPRVLELKKLRAADKEVDAALKRGPIYIVTALKIAKELKYTSASFRDFEAGVSSKAQISKEASVGAELSGTSARGNAESCTVLGDTVLAYQLHMVKKSGWRWWGDRQLEVRTYDPGNAGFMNQKESTDTFELETAALLFQDASRYAQEEEIGLLKSINVEDGEEEWMVICPEHDSA